MTEPPTLSPYLNVADARRAIEWYGSVFGAEPQGESYVMDDDRIGHAELRIGTSVLMLADEYPELDLLGPLARGGPSQSVHVQVSSCDETVDRAVAGGATVLSPPTDQPYGRNASFTDPFGHRWIVSQQSAG